jgi:hypothetical protein
MDRCGVYINDSIAKARETAQLWSGKLYALRYELVDQEFIEDYNDSEVDDAT